jgi:hypothetical protein
VLDALQALGKLNPDEAEPLEALLVRIVSMLSRIAG